MIRKRKGVGSGLVVKMPIRIGIKISPMEVNLRTFLLLADFSRMEDVKDEYSIKGLLAELLKFCLKFNLTLIMIRHF